MMSWTGQDWASAAAVVSAMAAAIAASISFWQAWQFRKQIDREEDAAKILRTFDHSAAASALFFESRKRLGQEFGSWYDDSEVDVVELEFRFNIKTDLLSSFNYVLNHFGRMASAYHYDVIDKQVAKELFSYSFVGFWRKFGPYLEREFEKSPSKRELYSHSATLFEEWRES